MTNASPLYSRFLGTWILQPHICEYEQGVPPASGLYRIGEDAGRVRFEIDWTDVNGEAHHVEFSGAPDGTRAAFAGGELADEIAVKAISERELTSYAYWQGNEIMVAQRQLDDTGQAMRVVQLVRFPDGSHCANTSVYVRAASS